MRGEGEGGGDSCNFFTASGGDGGGFGQGGLMHIPDGYLGPVTYGGLWAAMVPIWVYASRKVKKSLETTQIPFLAMASVFSLVAMVFAIPLPGGTTGHLNGTALVAILLGPWPAVIAVSVALVIQALVFGEGGVTALGANCFNIAFVGSITGYGFYRLITALRLLPKAIGAGIASYLSLNLGGLFTAIELGLQSTIHPATSSYFPFPLKIAIPAVMIPHLTILGLIEATLTVLVFTIILKSSPRRLTRSNRLPILFLAVSALLLVPPAHSHSIQYDVQQKGISVKLFYSKGAPATYTEYELFGPGDTQPHQTGRTDKNGFLTFTPEKPGVWKLKIWGKSSHGFHGVTIDVRVDQVLQIESFSKPPVAAYTKLIVGLSIIFGIFGIYALIRSRKKTE